MRKTNTKQETLNPKKKHTRKWWTKEENTSTKLFSGKRKDQKSEIITWILKDFTNAFKTCYFMGYFPQFRTSNILSPISNRFVIRTCFILLRGPLVSKRQFSSLQISINIKCYKLLLFDQTKCAFSNFSLF